MLKTNSMHRLRPEDSYYQKEVVYLSVFENMLKSGFKIDYFGGMKSNGMDATRYLNEDEKALVATVIQWLGTPVGQGYLKEVEDKIANE